jgi:DNA-binding winged helix-turn-helix (wHTH) protein/TolB-like protein
MEEVTEQSEPPVDTLKKGFRLKQFEVLPDQRLIKPPEGDPIKMEDRVMGVLEELAHAPRQILSQDHFMDTVWGDTVVMPQVLQRAIKLLRDALGDDARAPEFIKTYNRRGYELIVEVEPLEEPTPAEDTAPPAPRARSKSGLFGWIGLAAATVLATAGFVAWLGWQPDEPAKIAVIPFSAPDDSRLPMGGEGLADYLISALTDANDLRIVARRDSFAILGTSMDVETIGERLDAAYLVGGAMSLNGGTVMVTLTLTDTDSETDVWTEMIEGSVDDMAGLQSTALSALSEALVRKLGVAALVASETPDALSEEARQKLLEAQYQWHLRGELRLNRSIRLLREAIALRPDYAEAHLALAQSLATRPHYTDESLEPSYTQARQSLERVTELTNDLDSEVAALDGSMLMEERRWAESESKLQKALEIDPDNALANYWYSYLMANFGNYARALEFNQRAAELNPYSAVINNRLALAYLWVNDNESAAKQFQIASDLGYLDGTQMKIAVLNAVRNQQWQSISELLIWQGFSREWVIPFVEGLGDPEMRPEATEVIEAAMAAGEIARTNHFGIWFLYQDADRAIAAFDAGEKSQDIEMLWAPEADFLRQDPRFPDLVAAARLTPFTAQGN